MLNYDLLILLSNIVDVKTELGVAHREAAAIRYAEGDGDILAKLKHAV